MQLLFLLFSTLTASSFALYFFYVLSTCSLMLLHSLIIFFTDGAWLLISSVLVLGMSPALAMFETGLLEHNAGDMIKIQVISGVMIFSGLWFLIGFMMCFGEGSRLWGFNIGYLAHFDVSFDGCYLGKPSLSKASLSLFMMMFRYSLH
jgi:ammonia channel protein AmtB